MNQFQNDLNNRYIFVGLLIWVLLSQPSAAEANNEPNKSSSQTVKLQAEKPVPAKSKVLLHGEIDMLSYACKEAGLTLSSNTLPTTVKKVNVGSLAYYADIRTNDKIISANFKDNKFCISVSRAGTPYYTEIRLNSETASTSLASNSHSNTLTGSAYESSKQMIAIGFSYYDDNRKVNYVDPNSDLFGKVHIGDIYVRENDKVIPMPVNSHDNGTIAYPVFVQNGALHCYPCHRKPIDFFAKDLAQRFRHGFGAVYSP